MLRNSLRILGLSAGLIVSACGDGERLPANEAQPVGEYDHEANLLRTNGNDEATNAAMERARATFPQLAARLQNAPPGLTYLGVKVRLDAPNGMREHIWLYDVTYAEGRFAGKLVDDPQLAPNLHAGDVVRVEPGEISDWMTVEDGRACGAFTQRIVLAAMSDADRAAYFADMEIPRLPSGGELCDEAATAS